MGLINAIILRKNGAGGESQPVNFSGISDAINGLSRQMHENTELEVKSKDRVDITLAEYNRLTKENETLKASNQELEMWLEKIGLTPEVYKGVDPESIVLSRCDTRHCFKTSYMLTWDTMY